MSIPKTTNTPDDPNQLPPARRRRAKRGLIPEDLKSEAEDIERLAYSTSPSFDFFLFSLLAGAIITVGILLDSPALLVLGALAAPVMSPFIGISLGTASGSINFFLRRLLGTLVAGGLVFAVGLLGGYAAQVYSYEELAFASLHSRVHWSHLLLLSAGTIFTTLGVIQKKTSPLVPSVALAYELYIPLCVAGFGLGSGINHLWPDGVVVFTVHLVVMALLGTALFVTHGVRPLTFVGYTVGSLVILLSALLLLGISSAGAILGGEIALPTSSPTPSPTSTPLPPTNTSTPTPIPPTLTPTATIPTATPTLPPSPTSSPTLRPTPFYGEVSVAEEFLGAFIRSEPDINSQKLTSMINGSLVEILDPSPVVGEDGYSWLRIRYEDAEGEGEGWILENLLSISTPEPNW